MQFSVSLVHYTVFVYLLGLYLLMDQFIIVNINEFTILVSLMKDNRL